MFLKLPYLIEDTSGLLGVFSFVRFVLSANIAELVQFHFWVQALVAVLGIVELIANGAIKRGDGCGAFGHEGKRLVVSV